jgi:hypothetical protein
MEIEEKKQIMSAIINQLEQEYRVRVVPEKEVLEIGYNEAGIDNMGELVTELLEANFILRPAIGKLALIRKNTSTNTKAVKVIVTVERDDEEIRRVLYDEWLDTLTIEEIVEEITAAIDSIDEV